MNEHRGCAGRLIVGMSLPGIYILEAKDACSLPSNQLFLAKEYSRKEGRR